VLWFSDRPVWSQNGEQLNGSVKNDLDRGVVVEGVAHQSEGDKAGLREGDILLAWSRGDSKDEIRSPFDLAQAEIEQAPLGRVTIEGLRGGEAMAWSLGPTPWQVGTRPSFSGNLLSAYSEGRELARVGKAAETVQATERWKLLATRYSGEQTPWIPAWLFFHSAEVLRSGKQWKEADDAYQSALQNAVKTGTVIEAQVLQAWAATYQQRSDWTNAEKYFQQAIAKSQTQGGGTLATAASLDALGDIRSQRGDFGKAEQYCRQALEMKERLAPGSLPVATTLHNLGSVAYDRGDSEQAGEYYRQAFEIRNRLAPGSLALAASYTSLGLVARRQGDLSKWDEYEQKAFEIRKKLAPESFPVAASLNNLGMIAEARGDLTKAEGYYLQALDLKQKLVPGSLSVVGGLINLGNVEGLRGDLDKAEQYYRQALEIQQRVAPQSLNIAGIFGNLGKLEQYRGNLEKSEQYYRKTLEIQQRLTPGSLSMAAGLNDLGEVAEARGDLATAAEYYHQSLTIREKLAPESLSAAESFQSLGNVSRRLGDTAKAEQYYRQAVALREKLAPGSMVHAESLAAVASMLRDQQQPENAARLYAMAVSALENQTSHLGGSEEVRSSFGAQHSDIYRAYVDLLLMQKRPARAFEMLERSRARILLEMLAAAHVDVRKGADPSLLEQERSLRESLAAKTDRRLRLLAGKNSEKQVASFTKEIEDLEKQYQDVENRLRLSSPAYAALTQPQPLSAEDMQRELLDPGTLLLEYSLGEERSHVFVVSRDSLEAIELPKRAAIEQTARRLYSALALRSRHASADPHVQQAKMLRADSEGRRAAAELSAMILAPLRELLTGKRLLIVADGALHYIPFAALPSPSKARADAAVPLIVGHEIVNLPSASALAEIRRAVASRALQTHAQREVAVLADPVFDAADERVAGASKAAISKPLPGEKASQSTSAERLSRSVADMGMLAERGSRGYLERLLYTRQEARAIMNVTPRGQAMQALDFRASRATAMSPELARYRIIHFATHGLMDGKHPELSGLVLSLVDREGRRQDGFLGLDDIYNLNLPADLVVLSGCQTGLGEQINGEGVIGLTRGFMYAGASRVVASLWNVDDLATSQLMARFYRAMEEGKMRPAAALRQAQMEMWKQRASNSLYYWAGFQIQGEWK
jgi:CHAT domain-containing protein/tetratricopeptide (TPR) repeat protein